MEMDFEVSDQVAALIAEEELEKIRAQAFYQLVKNEVGFVVESEDAPEHFGLLLNVNDTFAFACADAELVAWEDMVEVYDLYNRYGYHGIVAWVARKRNMRPITCSCHHDGPKFVEACKELGYEPPAK